MKNAGKQGIISKPGLRKFEWVLLNIWCGWMIQHATIKQNVGCSF